MAGTAKKEDIYAIIDDEVDQQIINSQNYLVSAKWLYEVQGQHAISYDGIRAFAAWLAKHKLVVQTVSSDISTSGEGRAKRFHVKVRVKEANTGVIFEGVASQPQYGSRKDGSTYYDSTAETKAHSKAERNAIRKHIPPDLMELFVEEAKKYGQIKIISPDGDAPQGGSGTGQSKDAGWCKCAKPDPNQRPATEGKYEGLYICAECGTPVEGYQPRQERLE